MSNDEIKKFIDHSKLYTEVDFDQNKKVEEGVLDFIKGLFKSDDEAEEVIKKADPKVVTQLDKVVDDNDLDAFGGAGEPVTGEPVVTTADQANSIFQDPDATAAQRKAAQDFYNANKDDGGVAQGQNNNPNTDGGQARTTSTVQDPDDPMSAVNQEKDRTTVGQNDAMSAANQEKDRTTTTGEPEVDPTGNVGGADAADAAAAQGQDNNPNTDGGAAPSNGSLLGRKLDITTPNLMKAYNDGGKQSMPAIKNMQTALSRLGFDPNGIDGKYGNGTFKAVQDFQKANGLSVDGQAGPGTMSAIKKVLDDKFEKNKVTPDAEKALPADQDQSPQDGAEPEQQKSTAQQAADDFAGGDVQGGEFGGIDNRSTGQKAADEFAGGDVKGGEFGDAKPKVDPNDPMSADNQQKDIDTAQPNADLSRYIELLNKLEGGQQNAGTPNATQGRVVASYDFRNLMTLVENNLLNEQLTKAEMEELKALHTKVQGHVGIDTELDDKITAQLNRYLKLVKEPTKAAAVDQEGGVAQGMDQADAATKAAPKVSKESYIQMAPNRNASLANFNVSQMKKKYPKPYVDMPQADGTVHRGYGPLVNLEDFVKNNPKLKAKIIGKLQTASKDNNMKKAIKEASMNISINGDSAAEVAELAGILKNAGMHDAKPVSDIMPHADNSHDDMMSKMRMMDEPGPDDSPCGMGEEGVEEDWDNSPDESYADTQTMTHDLSGGLNRQKKSYPKVAGGDNPMAIETSIKEQLWAALNEKMTAEGRGRGKKMKLKASRGNEDIKTTEGSRGKKSRGKKSRG